MRSEATAPSSPALGITLRTALLAWLVALITVVVFALSIFPHQRRVVLDNLRSKAFGTTVSLGEVAASAVVNEDYSSVVDHCVEMIRRDQAIDFIIISRNDGFSLVHDRASWDTRQLDAFWQPERREPVGRIETVPLFNRRVYAYSQPFSYSGIEWGWIHVGLKLDAYDRSISDLYFRTTLVGALCLVFSFAVSLLYARLLVAPILRLQQVVYRVANGDLSARVNSTSSDELGQLARSVNAMTEAILVRDRTLQEANLRLEERVESRTRELREQKEAAEQSHQALVETQRRLFETSRLAGMAQVATGIIHNVGNVLNSVNVSANLLRDEVTSNAPLGVLQRTAGLLQQQGDGVHRFLTDDPHGRHVPGLIVEVTRELTGLNSRLGTELALLSENVNHIKQIVAVQQSYAKSGGLLQSFDPAELFSDALRITHVSLTRHEVTTRRDFPDVRPALTTDRHLALQILVNLVQNSIAALEGCPRGERHIDLRLRVVAGQVAFIVADNGVGIAPEDRARLFQHGFTTRKDGHGFGLHSGALAAANLGGSLTVTSPGLDRGATSTLSLPLDFPPTTQT